MATIKHIVIKRIRRFYTIVAIVLITIATIALSIWYHMPIEKHVTIKMGNQAYPGNHKELSVDFNIKRHLIFATEIHGQLRFDDELFVPLKTDEISVFQRIRKKINDEAEIPVWINSKNIGNIGLEKENINSVDISYDRLLSDLIYILYLNFDNEYMIETISLTRTSDGGSIWSSQE